MADVISIRYSVTSAQLTHALLRVVLVNQLYFSYFFSFPVPFLLFNIVIDPTSSCINFNIDEEVSHRICTKLKERSSMEKETKKYFQSSMFSFEEIFKKYTSEII